MEARAGRSDTWIRLACGVVLWVGVPLLLAFPCAILVYPGEWWGPGPGKGYSFSMEFLSALGRARTADGISNPWASPIFNGALVGCGMLYSLFFWPGRAAFVVRLPWRVLALACGWLMAGGLAGIGLTPYDRHPHIHDSFCSITCVSGFLAILIALMASGPRFEPPVSRWGTLGVLVLVLVVAGLVRIGIRGGHLSSRPAMPLLQKGAISLMVAWTYWQVWLMLRCPEGVAEPKTGDAPVGQRAGARPGDGVR
ncbi:MAG TPA: hypothetical protein PLU30_08955 [Verrucomicrobiae bacterium]|nr:hypothetical protein [Verrucomicrobiae bacterium]